MVFVFCGAVEVFLCVCGNIAVRCICNFRGWVLILTICISCPSVRSVRSVFLRFCTVWVTSELFGFNEIAACRATVDASYNTCSFLVFVAKSLVGCLVESHMIAEAIACAILRQEITHIFSCCCVNHSACMFNIRVYEKRFKSLSNPRNSRDQCRCDLCYA